MEHKISTVINTYNAERHLERVLDSVEGFDEVLICDMKSTDSTLAIAQRRGCMGNRERHIAFIHKDFPCSGAEQVTIDVANYLCRHGFKVTIMVINHRQEAYPKGTERLFHVHVLPKGPIKRSSKVASAVRDYVLNNQVSVLITYRELLYAHWLKRQTGVRMVFELHNTPGYEFLDLADKRAESRWKNMFYACGVEKILTWFYKSKYRRVYDWSDAYGVLCDSYKQELIEKLSLSRTDNKIWVLQNSIAQAFNPQYQKSKVVLYVGRLTHRDKRVDRLLRIWKLAQDHLPDWQLKIVGKGKAAENLKALASELQLQHCSFEGYSTHVAQYYDEASILCLTSSFEGWPMCVAEAQVRGVVPIVFNSFSAASDQVSTPNEGILVKPYDEKRFADELVLLANDETRLHQMQRSVVDKARSYSIERSGTAWIAMLNHLISIRP